MKNTKLVRSKKKKVKVLLQDKSQLIAIIYELKEENDLLNSKLINGDISDVCVIHVKNIPYHF